MWTVNYNTVAGGIIHYRCYWCDKRIIYIFGYLNRRIGSILWKNIVSISKTIFSNLDPGSLLSLVFFFSVYIIIIFPNLSFLSFSFCSPFLFSTKKSPKSL